MSVGGEPYCTLRERLSREDARQRIHLILSHNSALLSHALGAALSILFDAAFSTGKVSISATREDRSTHKQQVVQTLVVYAHEYDVIFASRYVGYRGLSNLFLLRYSVVLNYVLSKS